MSKRVIIGDIHGNLEALTAVLDDIGKEKVDEIVCLGDIVGFGPNPAECLDAVMQVAKVTLLGDLDEAVLFGADELNPAARKSVLRTRTELEQIGGMEAAKRRRRFLLELPRLHADEEHLFVHSFPREPTREYVFPEDVYNPRKMDALFKQVGRYCFVGHTHIPGIFTCRHEFKSPSDCNHVFGLNGEPTIINVGSVGQPRDIDPRACYVLLEDKRATFRRVDYPREITRLKLRGWE